MPDSGDPLWYKDAIIYQAHVKSFFDANNDGVGDFRGLTQKLDYLQDLGITCLWLLPFFPSPLKDDGYDIADYCSVHPNYGTLDDFKELVRVAHERGIRILIELVVNHTSDQHPWFQRARAAAAGSPERNFYVWSDDDKKFPETRIIFSDTEKSNWAYDPVAKQYYWHRFFSHQPDLNHNNPHVVEAVIGVMKFWLNLGVDALRLDAVPYLCVREGTDNANLPETHAVLKRIRAELDAQYQNRMLLAEANTWPADVRPYFGEGDECHMAFHFPLMPRMFMALRQEDRHAITEIIDQTPDIPDTSQWALFLRNHDELTLEMVTDEERDYMYQAYAADPQMRLNGGIRRRLAPLVENSRRRVELLNNLLFSLPGTPIVYYGDELGMGDNIYLGDRNGVRTPMQWSGDRNGGFSRTDPARLFAPPIMDPVYGYQAINVEAQERYPFSLLNWMKRLIAVRKQHRVFGRGSIEFVHCPNRKILAFIRRDESESILVVANLSRTLQPAELDLSAWSGLIPTEMNGLADFPRIGEQPFFLSLGPYASYWFTLDRAPMHIAQQPAPAPPGAATVLASALPSILVGADWSDILDSATRATLERSALVPFLQRQQWFLSRTRRVRQARFSDWGALRKGPLPAFLATVSVAYDDEWQESYAVPLAFADGEQAARVLADSPSRVLARITGARKGILFDAWLDDDALARIFETMSRRQSVPTVRGSVGGEVIAGTPEIPSDAKWTRGPGDDSNSLAFAGDRYTLKMYRRVAPGPNPEFEIERLLTERGFRHVPPLVAALRYDRQGLEPGTLAILLQAIKHQGTAWDFTIDELGRFYERAAAKSVHPEDDRWSLLGARRLGKRTAELHQSLASSTDPAFAPEPFDARQLEATAAEMLAHGNATIDLLQSGLSGLPEVSVGLAEQVISGRDRILAHVGALADVKHAGQRIRIHGDFHLGMVLRSEEDFVIVDFEGEPSRTRAERRAKYSPLVDVASMARSFSYAAQAALLTFTLRAPGNEEAILASVAEWERKVTAAFVSGYKSVLGPPILPDRADFSRLLDAFIVDKALRQLANELHNRPEWIRIPLAALASVLHS